MGCAFTLEHYREILEAALRGGYVFQGFHVSDPTGEKVIYLRHDLDISLEEALDMATLEAELGIRATYFLLINSPIYNLLADDTFEFVQYLRSRGHWIGLHVDPRLLRPGEAPEAESIPQPMDAIDLLCKRSIEFYSARIPLVPVVSFHRPTPAVLGRDFNSFISTYSPRFFTDITYISDSRGVWRDGCPCERLRHGAYSRLQILVHPIWWKQVETESSDRRVLDLLDKRLESFKEYIAVNIEPFNKLLKGEA